MATIRKLSELSTRRPRLHTYIHLRGESDELSRRCLEIYNATTKLHLQQPETLPRRDCSTIWRLRRSTASLARTDLPLALRADTTHPCDFATSPSRPLSHWKQKCCLDLVAGGVHCALPSCVVSFCISLQLEVLKYRDRPKLPFDWLKDRRRTGERSTSLNVMS